MEPYQQRVVDEKADLDAKLQRLNGFFDTDTFAKLDPTDQELMERQASFMQGYSDVLGMRINRFTTQG